jgi:hypothetical protein
VRGTPQPAAGMPDGAASCSWTRARGDLPDRWPSRESVLVTPSPPVDRFASSGHRPLVPSYRGFQQCPRMSTPGCFAELRPTWCQREQSSGRVRPSRCPHPAMSTTAPSADPAHMACFSSRGWLEIRRCAGSWRREVQPALPRGPMAAHPFSASRTTPRPFPTTRGWASPSPMHACPRTSATPTTTEICGWVFSKHGTRAAPRGIGGPSQRRPISLRRAIHTITAPFPSTRTGRRRPPA